MANRRAALIPLSRSDEPASPGTPVLRYGRQIIPYQLSYAKRKTLEIAVHPDGRIAVKAPEDASMDAIEKRLKKRAGWIIHQLDYFRQFHPRTPDRSYIRGESHLYLGRHYRLKFHSHPPEGVTLSQGRLCVSAGKHPTPDRIKGFLDVWYTQKAELQFQESMERCWPAFKRLKLQHPKLHIRHMKTRWGSLSQKGTLTLNTNLVKAPKECIDYVVTHELCHLVHHNHSPDFYKLLSKSMPNWKKTKHRLELALA